MPEVQVHTPTGSSSDESRTTLDPLTDDLSGYGSGTNEGASTIQPLSLHQHGSPLQGFAGGHSRSPFMLSTLPDSTGLQNDGLDSGDEATTDDGGSMLHSEMGHSSLTHAPPSIPTPVRPGRSRTLHRVLFSSPPLGSLRATFSAKPAAAPCPEVLAAGDMGEPSRASPLRAPPPAAVLEQDPASVPRTQQGNRACASDVSGKWARRAHRFLQVGGIIVSGPKHALPSPERLHAHAHRHSPTRRNGTHHSRGPDASPMLQQQVVPEPQSSSPPLTPTQPAHLLADAPTRPQPAGRKGGPQQARPAWGCFGKLGGCFRGQV